MKEFLSNWLFAACVLGLVCLFLVMLAAPMLLPVLLGVTWWVFILMGLTYFFVISLIVAVVGGP